VVTKSHDGIPDRVTLFFQAYVQLGDKRSLSRLRAVLLEAGIEISVASLKRYSKQYRWRMQIVELEKSGRQQAAKTAGESILAMQERHTQLARAMQGAGGSALQRLLGSDTRLAVLKPSDITRLIDLGLKSERHALGAATDRREMAIEIFNDLVVDLVAVFKDVNDEPEPRLRARLFARNVDRLVTNRLGELKRKEDRL